MERRPADDSREPVEPRPAATVVLVRDGPEGLEVLLTRRPDSMAFAAGLQVFPGGRVEPADADPALVARARGPLAEPNFRVAHRIAAIRETWEEVGLLLAEPATRRHRSAAAERQTGTARDEPTPIERDPATPFGAFIERRDLELRTDELVEVARWTTPRAYPRRFDAHFFVAELPAGARLVPDRHEVADHAWWTPRDALAAMARGQIAMWPPTSTTLQRLERAASFRDIRDGLGRVPEPPIAVERLEPDLRLVRGQNAFGPGGRPANTILVGRREVVVVDPGDPGDAFLDVVEAEVAAGGGQIAAIALTHVDPGHASGSEELHERTGASILVGPGGSAPLPWDTTEIADGAAVGHGDGRLTALATPGHRPDHLAFLRPDGTLLTGDALLDRPTVLLPPEGDSEAHRASLVRIRALLAEGVVRRVMPGHGPAFLADPAAAIEAAIKKDAQPR